jgi:hypothetical protein
LRVSIALLRLISRKEVRPHASHAVQANSMCLQRSRTVLIARLAVRLISRSSLLALNVTKGFSSQQQGKLCATSARWADSQTRKVLLFALRVLLVALLMRQERLRVFDARPASLRQPL